MEHDRLRMGLFAVLLIIAIALVMRQTGSQRIRDEDSAREVLRRRYAVCQIDEDAFNRRRTAPERWF